MFDSFVRSVTIFDYYILITFNYKKGSERVAFEDIKSSDLKSVGGPKQKPTFDVVGGTPTVSVVSWIFNPISFRNLNERCKRKFQATGGIRTCAERKSKVPICFHVPNAHRLIGTQAFRPYREHEVELGLLNKP